MLHRDPLIGRKLVDDPVAAEPSETAILLATERIVRKIIDRLIVDMGHAGLHLKREGKPSIFIPRDNGPGQSGIGVVGDPQGFGFILHFDDGSDGTEDFFSRDREKPRKRRTLRQRIGHLRPCGITVNPALFLLFDVDPADERRRTGDALEFASSPGKGESAFALILFPDTSHFSVGDVLALVRADHTEGALVFLAVFTKTDGGLTVDFCRMNPRMGGSIGMPNEHRPVDHASEDSLTISQILNDSIAVPARGRLARFDGLGLGAAEESRAHDEQGDGRQNELSELHGHSLHIQDRETAAIPAATLAF